MTSGPDTKDRGVQVAREEVRLGTSRAGRGNGGCSPREGGGDSPRGGDPRQSVTCSGSCYCVSRTPRAYNSSQRSSGSGRWAGHRPRFSRTACSRSTYHSSGSPSRDMDSDSVPRLWSWNPKDGPVSSPTGEPRNSPPVTKEGRTRGFPTPVDSSSDTPPHLPPRGPPLVSTLTLRTFSA